MTTTGAKRTASAATDVELCLRMSVQPLVWSAAEQAVMQALCRPYAAPLCMGGRMLY